MQISNVLDQVWLFGSYARGEFNSSSDVDILYVAEEDCADLVYSIVDRVNLPKGRIDLCHYSREGLAHLVSRGALFARHLKKEGKPIYEASSWLFDLLETMPEYNNHIYDLTVLMQLVEEMRGDSKAYNYTTIFDAGVLSTVIRNTGIILTNYLGVSDYSPNAPLMLSQIEPKLKVPLAEAEYIELLNCRHISERGEPVMRARVTAQALERCAVNVHRWQFDCLDYLQEQGVRHAG